jgi:hypothetical protein
MIFDKSPESSTQENPDIRFVTSITTPVVLPPDHASSGQIRVAACPQPELADSLAQGFHELRRKAMKKGTRCRLINRGVSHS